MTLVYCGAGVWIAWDQDLAPAWLFGAAALGVGATINNESRSGRRQKSPIEDPEREKAMYIHVIVLSITLSLFLPKFNAISKPVSSGTGGFDHTDSGSRNLSW